MPWADAMELSAVQTVHVRDGRFIAQNGLIQLACRYSRGSLYCAPFTPCPRAEVLHQKSIAALYCGVHISGHSSVAE